MPKTNDVVGVLEENVKSRGAADGGKSGRSESTLIGVLEKGLSFAEVVELVIVFLMSNGLVDG